MLLVCIVLGGMSLQDTWVVVMKDYDDDNLLLWFLFGLIIALLFF